jgi:cytoskeletal protein RodZ
MHLGTDSGGITGSWPGWPDLAEFRRSRKISVDEIAALTNIGADYLTAIERGDFDKLPGGVYTTSFIRQYARIIDYPEQDLLAVFHAGLATPTPARIECQDELSPGSSRPRIFRWLSSIVS